MSKFNFTNATIENNSYSDVVCFLSHSTTAVNFQEEIEYEVNGNVEYEGQNFDVISYFNSLDNAILAASINVQILFLMTVQYMIVM